MLGGVGMEKGTGSSHSIGSHTPTAMCMPLPLCNNLVFDPF